MAAKRFSEEDVRASWRWLGHEGFTELVALHPEYKPGKENYEHNKEHDAFPRVWYTRNEEELVQFVAKYQADKIERMVCYSLNDRPGIFKNERGFVRAAKEEEIQVARNLLIDIDIQTALTVAHYEAVQTFLAESDAYFRDQGFHPPVRSFTGRGFHLRFAYPAIDVAEHPDVAERQAKFVAEYRRSYDSELANLEARIDSTQYLRAMVKIDGTAKPQVGIQSRFYGETRMEDPQLRKDLLSMNLDATLDEMARKPFYGPTMATIGTELPLGVTRLIRRDPKFRDLYEGRGKACGQDTSRSGFDFSVSRYLFQEGIGDVSVHMTTLAVRPNGAYANGEKTEHYLRRTIAKAFMS